MVDANYCVTYANQSLSSLFDLSPESIVGQCLIFGEEKNDSEAESRIFALCPPRSLIHRKREAQRGHENSVDGYDRSHLHFSVQLPNGEKYGASCMELSFEEQDASTLLMCSLEKMDGDDQGKTRPHWMHEKIQEFRVGQSSKYNAIPYLGESYAARKCFAQARSFALIESNVLVVGHPESQILEVAKSIHYSGFTKLDEPEPLLPVNCQQVNGERIQEILVGHCQVNLSESDESKAHVLLMYADEMDSLAQRDILAMVNLDQLNLRLIATSRKPLLETEGFDEELAQRLSTLELKIPDLSDRRADVPILAQKILEQLDSSAISLSDELVQYLQIYPWASDYRELESVIESASLQARGAELVLADCPHDFRMALNALDNPVPKIESIDLDQLLADIESEAIERAIEHANGNKTLAARILGITRARLHRKIADSTDSTGEA